VQFDRNQLWPEIDLQGSYAANGRGTSFETFAERTAGGNTPTWAIGVLLTVPLGKSRRARQLPHRPAGCRPGVAQPQVARAGHRRGVDNAVGHVETNLKSVEAARAATRLAQESLDAEKKKLLAGTSTTFLVLQAQSQLATARSAEIRAEADYSESIVALDLAEGTILDKNNIVLDEKY